MKYSGLGGESSRGGPSVAGPERLAWPKGGHAVLSNLSKESAGSTHFYDRSVESAYIFDVNKVKLELKVSAVHLPYICTSGRIYIGVVHSGYLHF